MDITKTELLKKYVIREDGLEFQPSFSYDVYNEETQTYMNFMIIKSAEEIKAEYEKLKSATE